MLFTSAAVPRNAHSSSIRLAALLVIIWLLAMGRLLWYFEQQRLAATQQLFHFETRDLPAPPPTAVSGIGKALYFLDKECRCDGPALAEIKRLQRSANSAPMQFMFAATAIDTRDIDAQSLSAEERVRWQPFVPTTPAVALWDASDKLIYFGPINVGANCGDGNSYLQAAWRLLNRVAVPFAAESTSWDVAACACSAKS